MRLSITEEENQQLKANFLKAKEEIKLKEKEKGCPHHQLSAVEKNYDTVIASRRELNKECEEAEEDMKKKR